MTLGFIALWCLLSTNTEAEITVRELQHLSVIDHYFTTAISNGLRKIFTKDASKGRYIVLKLAATLQKDEGKIFTNDFALRYFHSDGSEDRTDCDAIAIAKTAKPGESGRFAMGSSGASIRVNRGKVYFCLAFFIEKDVDKIDIYRLGIAEPLTYHIGTDRLYSVFVCTNKDSHILSEAVEVIKAGGYRVVETSKNLPRETKGTTILYRDQAESQAREISQRLMTKLGVVPTLKKMKLISDNDIVVWLGK